MFNLKPIHLVSEKTSVQEKLTSAEMGKLWATYMGNSMSKYIITYFLHHVEDEDIRTLLEDALTLSEEFMKTAKVIFEKENFPVPIGFTEEDVNVGAPRLFQDQYYVHYLKYALKKGLSLYLVAIPLVFREDVKVFFLECLNASVAFLEQINTVLIAKGFIKKPPIIPVPEKVKFVKEDFLNGFFGHVRPLHALEIAHLYDNIENVATSNALILGFYQVVKSEKIRELFKRGEGITHRLLEDFSHKLGEENLPSLSYLTHLVTASTMPPFSDKLMLFHKVDMFSMKIRAFGNSMAVDGRHDTGVMYGKALVEVGVFVEEGAKIMIENGWMEQPPEAADRERLNSN